VLLNSRLSAFRFPPPLPKPLSLLSCLLNFAVILYIYSKNHHVFTLLTMSHLTSSISEENQADDNGLAQRYALWHKAVDYKISSRDLEAGMLDARLEPWTRAGWATLHPDL
jgi:hypothetical protein